MYLNGRDNLTIQIQNMGSRKNTFLYRLIRISMTNEFAPNPCKIMDFFSASLPLSLSFLFTTYPNNSLLGR